MAHTATRATGYHQVDAAAERALLKWAMSKEDLGHKAMSRFWAKVDRQGSPDACWLWTAALYGGGYGHFWAGAQRGHTSAHRFSYEALVGPIPDGLDLDHLCRNRRCVNPTHLEPVTRRENTLRGETIPAREVTKTHCIHGHPLSGDNLYHYPSGRGRLCRKCGQEKARLRRAKLGIPPRFCPCDRNFTISPRCSDCPAVTGEESR